MTEPQQPAAPLEVDDLEPAPPEPNPTLDGPALEPPESDQSHALETPQAFEEEHVDDAPPASETEAPEPDADAAGPGEESAYEPEAAASRGTGRAAFGRPLRGRGPACRRRPLRIHGPRGELPRRPRGARRRGDPRRGDAARGRGGVHGRGLRTAHRETGGLSRDARGRCGEPGHRDPHRVAGLDTDVRDRRPGRARPSRPGGIPGGRPDRVLRAACQMERRACYPSTSLRPRSRRPSGRHSAAGPARSCCRFPRTCSMRSSRVRPGSRSAAHRRLDRQTRMSAPCSVC